MVSSRKASPASPGDVPSLIVAALLVYLVAVLAPLVAVTPDLPATLPPLHYRSAFILSSRGDARPSEAMPFVDERFAVLGAASARHDGPATAAAQRDFVAFLVDARATTTESRASVRERHLRAFLHALDTGGSDPLLTIAQRHRLAGMYADPGIDRATLVAWFDFRWEALAAPESLRGERVALAALVDRMPPAERPAITAWVLSATCESLLGVRPGTELPQRDLAQCAAVRGEFVDMASALDPAYPWREAHAAVEVLLARALDRRARGASDAEARGALRTASREAYERAQGHYTVLASGGGSRRFRRYLRGAIEAVAAD
ncbi:MAG: hypothetical protein WCJ30_06670 [Deltaproteobacteria bacterium]